MNNRRSDSKVTATLALKEALPARPIVNADYGTGLPWLTTWARAYIFVLCSFVFWTLLLIELTELSRI